MEHIPHPRFKTRAKKAHKTSDEHLGFNGWLATIISNAVGTMWCAYFFALLALISLPAAISGGTATLVAWTAQTFIQLVLLSIIMVGQKIAAVASDKQAEATFKDAEALLQISDEVHRLIKINNEDTSKIVKTIQALKSYEKAQLKELKKKQNEPPH